MRIRRFRGALIPASLAVLAVVIFFAPSTVNAQSGVLSASSPCVLPGPEAPDRCTVSLSWSAQGAPVYCIWSAGTAGSGPFQLNACQGFNDFS
jgi:hypothetical protein